MSFTDLLENGQALPQESCLQEFTSDAVSPKILLTPVIRKEIEIVVTCARSHDEGFTQNGKRFTVYSPEADVPNMLMEFTFWTLVKSPYAKDKGMPILVPRDNTFKRPIRFKAEIYPSSSSKCVIFPTAELSVERMEPMSKDGAVRLVLDAKKAPLIHDLMDFSSKNDNAEVQSDETLWIA